MRSPVLPRVRGATPLAESVTFSTAGASFSPTIELTGGSDATVTWTVVETGQTATGLSPTISFGSAAPRTVTLSATHPGGGASALPDVVTINLGFNHLDDAGIDNLGAGYDKAPESVTGVAGLPLCTGLIQFMAANIPALVGHLSLTGLSQLQFVECFQSRLTSIDLTGCTSLIRLCMEQCNLAALDLNPVTGSLRDLRAAAQQGGMLAMTPLASPITHLWHYCVRDQVVVNEASPGVSLPVLEQLWIWNTGQSGTLDLSGLGDLSSLLAYENAYTAVDLTGCTLGQIDLHANALGQAAVDSVLTTVDSWGVSSGALDLGGNAAPSSTGLVAKAALEARGWTVTTSAGGGASTGWADDFQRGDATGLAAVGNGWAAVFAADANINAGDLVRTDSGSYRVLYNPTDGDLPANYRVTATIAGASKAGGFLGVMGRWASGNGVAGFWNSSSSSIGQLYVMDANNYLANAILVTPDSAIPASWTNSGVDSTMAVEFVGTTVNILLDGVLVGHATSTRNSSAIGTGVGMVGEGNSRRLRSITVTV